MTRFALAILALLLAARPAPTTPSAPQVRFTTLDIFIDSAHAPLAAWQFELKVTSGDAKIVGVEGGDVAGFQNPPYYDPAALQNNRIIIGAFSTSATVPTGKTRIARLHMAVETPAKPAYTAHLIVAGSPNGASIPARISLEEGTAK